MNVIQSGKKEEAGDKENGGNGVECDFATIKGRGKRRSEE